MSTYRFPLGLSDIYNDGYSCDLRKSKAMYVGGNQYMQTQSYTITVDVTGEDGQAGYYISSNNIGGYLFNWKIVNGYGTTEQDHNEYVFFGNDISWDCLSGTERVGKIIGGTEITMYNDQSTNYHYTHYMSLSNSTFSLSICPTIIIVIPTDQPYALQMIPECNEQTPSTVLCTVNCKYAFYANEPSNTGYSYNSAWPTGYIKTNSFTETYSETVPTNNSGLLNRLFKPTEEEANSFIGYFITDLNYDNGYLKCNPTTFTDLNIDSMSAYQSVYLFVKSVIDITSYGESSSYPLGGYPTTYFSADVFGPFYLVYIPSTTFAMSCSMEHLLQIDSPANATWNNNTLYFPSCSYDIAYSGDMLSIVYGPVGMTSKYCFVKPINSSNTTYITCTNNPFELERTASAGYTITEKKSVTIKGNAYSAPSTLNLSSDSYSAVNADVSIYNAYDVEVYNSSAYTVSGTSGTTIIGRNLTNNLINSTTNDNIKTTDTISVSQGDNVTLYIREVIKERTYSSSGFVENIFDFKGSIGEPVPETSNNSIYSSGYTPTLTHFDITSSSYITTPSSSDILYYATVQNGTNWSGGATGNGPIGSVYRLKFSIDSNAAPQSQSVIEIEDFGDSNLTLRIPVEVSGTPLTDFTTSYVQNESSGNVSSGWISMSNNGSYTINTAAASGYIHILTTPDPSTANQLNGGFIVSGTACDPINASTNIGDQFQIPYFSYGSVNLTITTGTITRTYSFTISPLAITDITVKDSDNHEISSVDLWEVPEEYNDENYNATVWQLSGQEINLSFTPSPSGNSFSVSCSQGLEDIFNLTNFTIPYTTNNIVWNDSTNNLDVIENGDTIAAGDRFNCDPSSGNVRTTILFPNPGANEDLHSTGTYQLSFISDNENALVTVNVYRTSITLTASISGSSYNADTSINIVLTKTGDETWTDVLDGVTVTGTSLPTGFAVSTQNTTNTISVKFPASMTNNWSGTLTVNAKNHYGQTISATTSSITIAPVAISGITTDYCDENGYNIDSAYTLTSGENVDIDSYTGDPHWFEYPGYIYFTGVVDPSTATNRNVTISLADNTTNSRIPTGNETKASGEVFTVVLTGKNTNPSTQTRIKLAAAGASSIYTEYYITPLMYTNTLTAKYSTSPYSTIGNTRINVEAGSFEDIRIYFNGNESSSSMANRITTSCSSSISSVDVSVQSIPSNSDYVVYRISPPSSITSTTNGTITFTYDYAGYTHTVDVNIKVVIDQSIYSIELTSDENVVYGEEYVKLTINHGSSVSSYVLEGTGGLKYATSYNGPWSDGNASGLTFNVADYTEIYIKNVSSSLVTKTFTVTASQHDTGETPASDSVEVTFGTIEYTQSIKNGSGSARTYSGTVSAYAGDNVTYIAKLTPALGGTVNPGSYWNVSGHSYSNFRNVTYSTGGNSTYTTISFYGEIQTANTATSATFYKDSFEGNSHTFSLPAVNVWSRDNDVITIEDITLNALDNETVEETGNIILLANNHISTINSVSVQSITQEAFAANLRVSLANNNTKVKAQVDAAPSTNTSFALKIIATNALGDTVTNNSAGTLYWKIGRTGYEFSGSTTKYIDGSINESTSFNIVCKYHDAVQGDINCTFRIVSTTYTNGTGTNWCSSSIDGTNDHVVNVSSSKKNYTDANRTAKITLGTTFNNTVSEEETLDIYVVQYPITVDTVFTLSSNIATIDNTNHTASYKFKTRTNTSISFGVVCKYREKRHDGTNYFDYIDVSYSLSTTTPKPSWISTITTNQAELRITANANTSMPGSANSDNLIFTASYGSSEKTLSYNVHIEQDTFVYSNAVLSASPNPLNVGVLQGNSDVTITCTYDASADGTKTTHTYSNWTFAVASGSSTWLGATKSNNILNVTYGQNTSSQRTGTITLSVDYTAGGFPNTLTHSPVTLTVQQEYSSIAFGTATITGLTCESHANISNTVSSPTLAWSTKDSSSWITLDPSSGTATQGMSGMVATVHVNVSDNYNPNAVSDYSKYRSNTSSRTGYYRIQDEGNNTARLSVSQNGYTFDPSCTVQKSQNTYDASATSGYVDITTNYDIIINCTSNDWCIFGTFEGDGYISGTTNYFDTTDGPSVTKHIRVPFTLTYNTGNTRQLTFSIQQKIHETGNNNVENCNANNVSVTITQAAADYSLKILTRTTDTEQNAFQVSAYTGLRNEDYKIRSTAGGWLIDSITYSGSSVDWVTVTPNSGTYSTDSVEQETYYKDTNIVITVSPNSDIENGRTCEIIFKHAELASLTKTFTITQLAADVFVVCDTNLDNLITVVNNKEDYPDRIISSTKLNPDPIASSVLQKSGGRADYYVFLFTGGAADARIDFAAGNGMAAETGTITNIPIYASQLVDLNSEYNYNERGNCIIKGVSITTSQNNTTLTRPVGLVINTTVSNNSISVTYSGDQVGSSYNAEFYFAQDKCTIGTKTEEGNYVIPVYGGTYDITVINELVYDSIIITNIYLDNSSVYNPDNENNGSVDVSNWAEFFVKTGPSAYTPFADSTDEQRTIGYTSDNKSKDFRIKIKEYAINEEHDAGSDIGSNEKIYVVWFDAVSLSNSSAAPTTHAIGYGVVSDNILQVKQMSKNLYEKTSWKLLANTSDSATGKGFAPSDFGPGSPFKLHSNDTGYIVRESGQPGEHINDEVEIIQDIVVESNIALDERFIVLTNEGNEVSD